jgi:hypothetical protein
MESDRIFRLTPQTNEAVGVASKAGARVHGGIHRIKDRCRGNIRAGWTEQESFLPRVQIDSRNLSHGLFLHQTHRARQGADYVHVETPVQDCARMWLRRPVPSEPDFRPYARHESRFMAAERTNATDVIRGRHGSKQISINQEGSDGNPKLKLEKTVSKSASSEDGNAFVHMTLRSQVPEVGTVKIARPF